MSSTPMTLEEIRERATRRQAGARKLKELLVDRLDLPIDPEWITDDQPLFGRGLELDSVDALELAVGIDTEADVTITDDQVGVFGSINRIIDFMETHEDELIAFAEEHGLDVELDPELRPAGSVALASQEV